MDRNEDMIRALLEERAQLVRAGKADRVKQVDEQLELRGYSTREEAPRGRRAARGETAADRGE